ncbi:MAG: hypothetical protein GY729_16295 [Desulfobacteraceae bacterium]|nr:hypothetical protein [Desulfobacteraceae bacterium]
MQRFFISTINFWCLVIILFFLILTAPLAANELKTVAVLPFEVNSPEDISHIRAGINKMLFSRLSWKGHVKVLEKRIIKKDLAKLKDVQGNALIKQISQSTDSKYVVAGSITQFANSFSLDAKVYDIENKRYLTFFEQSKKIDDIIPKLDHIAAKINKTVFDRITVSYEEMEKQKKADIEKWKRQNPEHLMKNLPRSHDTSPPAWKIWEYLF